MSSTLQIVLDPRSPAPALRQIVDQLRHYLVSGALKPGDPLPSVRRLAIDLGVHHNTIADAYRTLAGEGWLDVSQGRAVRVVERSQPVAAKRSDLLALRDTFGRRLQHLIAEMRAQGVPEEWIDRELRAASKGFSS